MATGSNAVLRDIKTLFDLGAIGAQSDAELLEQFLARRGQEAEDAFAAVVGRHGPMVLRVCRRVLTDPNDAEDAFQVTFLVLARKARAIARREQLANWLYGVAVRSAKEVKKTAARRRAREGPVENIAHAQSRPDDEMDDLRFVIDDELSRLPEPFRAPVVLCDLEGKSHKEAARLLGVPVGTVSSRVSRGRGLLRQRLARRGLELPAERLVPERTQDATSTALPPALVAVTSRAAARFVIEGHLAGSVPAYVATITEGVLKAMLVAKLTSKSVLIPAILFLSLGTAAVGVVYRAYSQAKPWDSSGPYTTGRDADHEWSWVDNLKNADLATRERLKRCASSATRNFASIHRLIFDFDLTTEAGQLDKSGKTKKVDSGFFRGTVYWKDGSVRYDKYYLASVGPTGQKSFFRKPKVYSVVRSRDMLAYTEENAAWGLFLTVHNPPQSDEEWEYRTHAYHRRLDPWLHYAEPFCAHRTRLREFLENCRAIESEEANGKVILRFLLPDKNWNQELTCDGAADWLPVLSRGGSIRDGKWSVDSITTDEWQKASGVWYPIHHVETRSFGRDYKSIKEIDLNVRNLRANAAANVTESDFALSAMNVPEGTPGLDRRSEPFRWLIRAGGVVRQPRPGEMPNPKTPEEMKVEQKNDEETVPADDAAAPRPPGVEGGSPVSAESVAPNREYLSLLEEYESAQRNAEKASALAKTDQERRAALEAIGRLEWSYAGKFLAFARKYPGDAVAIDALGGLVAGRFTPPEAEPAADILIRDHLKSDKLISVYRQLATPSAAWSTAGERLLRAAAENASTPEARGRACLYLGYLLVNRAAELRMLRGPDRDPLMEVEELLRSGGQQLVKRTDDDPATVRMEGERFFDRVVERFAGVRTASGTLGETAANELFKLRELVVGKPAPEIEGADVDGKPFRLSDYRGKVVVVGFSGNWCGPCRAMYPHERKLVERMKGRPFALLSVNTDDDKETLRKSLSSGEITWRCWWEGGAKRPNCARWRLDAIPMVYVLDANGIICAKDVRGKAIDQVVDRLVEKADPR